MKWAYLENNSDRDLPDFTGKQIATVSLTWCGEITITFTDGTGLRGEPSCGGEYDPAEIHWQIGAPDA